MPTREIDAHNSSKNGATTLSNKVKESISVKDFGATGDGVTDDTVSIQNAINYAKGSVSIYLPCGVYKLTSTIKILHSKTKIYGDNGATSILFSPKKDSVCFHVESINSEIFQIVIKDLNFYSDDILHTKIAIKLVDVSASIIENICTQYPHWLGNKSIFLNILGRDTSAIRGLNISANRPIVISPIPLSHNPLGIGIDHFHFSDCYLLPNGYPAVEIEGGVNLTQVTFDGYQAWVGGTYGFYWADKLTSAISEGLVFNNVRTEGQYIPSTYQFYIDHHYGLQGVEFKNCYGGLSQRGYFFRNCSNVKIDTCFYVGGLESINIDKSVIGCVISNAFWQAKSTAKISGQRIISASPQYPNTAGLPSNIIYDSITNANLNEVHDAILSSTKYTVLNNSVGSFLPHGVYIAILSSVAIDKNGLGNSAIFSINGSSNNTVVISDTSNKWSNKKGTIGKNNLYWSVENGRYELENLTGLSNNFSVLKLGTS